MAIVLILTSESLLREKAKSTATLPVITDGVEREAETNLKTFKRDLLVDRRGVFYLRLQRYYNKPTIQNTNFPSD